MSITLSVGANGAATGRTDQTIAGDGEIDNRAEAEAALAFLPDGSTNTVKVGSREYTRAQLIEIRDRAAAPAPGGNAVPPANNGDTVPGDGASHGVALDGFGFGGLGPTGHNGGGFTLRYVAGVPILTRDWRLFFDPTAGLRVARGTMDFQTPGGEGANSAYTSYGLTAGGDLRVVPPVWDHRLGFAVGLRGSVSGFNTADSTTVSTPGNCTPGDFGRGECEPGAGPQTGNAGTTGVYNPRVGNSRGTSGVALDLDIPVTVSADVARGDWGNVSLYAQFLPGLTGIMPSDGDGFSFWRMGGGLGVMGRFGGSAVERPRNSGPTTDDRVVEASRPAGQALSLSDAQIREMAELPTGASIQGVQFDNHPEDTTAPYDIRAEWMTAGPHELKVRYRMPGDSADRIRVVRISVGTPEPVRVPEGGTGEAYGLVLSMPDRAVRLPNDVVGGVSTPRPIPLGSIQTTAAFPEGATYQVYVDGNPVGTPAPLSRDRSTALTLPATTGDGPHQVEIRVSRPGQAEIRYPARAVAVGPGTATLSAASVPSNPPSGGHYFNDPVTVRVSSDVATRARISVGSHTEDVNLTAGVNNVTLAGAPKSWTTGGAAGRSTQSVRIQPLDAAGAPVGTAVDVGSVVIRRAGGGGGRRNPAPTGNIPRPPRR